MKIIVALILGIAVLALEFLSNNFVFDLTFLPSEYLDVANSGSVIGVAIGVVGLIFFWVRDRK